MTIKDQEYYPHLVSQNT